MARLYSFSDNVGSEIHWMMTSWWLSSLSALGMKYLISHISYLIYQSFHLVTVKITISTPIPCRNSHYTTTWIIQSHINHLYVCCCFVLYHFPDDNCYWQASRWHPLFGVILLYWLLLDVIEGNYNCSHSAQIPHGVYLFMM